ncbi:hypothetical protein [Hymenobacter wooponensis]|uniref:Uncharacterized protein n=1 Tax=Hymenobacter wooponensis TaxID=1525360 RepID=A0A4Z0MJA9_9BACT|nr:hypothetical protein [Hymenobacter wooponensis]TGD79378.1 hypothetical protein EU557_14175 [Hymenobacter wooponensis]
MSLLSVYPHLKQISRNLAESASSITCQHFRTEIRFRWHPTTSKQKRAGYLYFGAFASIWTFISFKQEAYSMLIWLAIFGLLIWGEKRWRSVNLNALSLHNDVRIDTGARQVLVVHLSDLYRREVERDRLLSFDEVRAVGVEPSGYAGILYLELADASQLFLLEVEAENIAQQIAYVLRRVIGLPEPALRAWWKF